LHEPHVPPFDTRAGKIDSSFLPQNAALDRRGIRFAISSPSTMSSSRKRSKRTSRQPPTFPTDYPSPWSDWVYNEQQDIYQRYRLKAPSKYPAQQPLYVLTVLQMTMNMPTLESRLNRQREVSSPGARIRYPRSQTQLEAIPPTTLTPRPIRL
jgi:hypothetical protein